MSSITIYHPTLDQALDLLIERTRTSMTRGREALVDTCINMAETQEYIANNYRKKQRGAVQKEVADKLDVKPKTFFKYAQAGALYLSAPEKRQLTLEEVLEQKKPQNPAKAKASLVYAHRLTKDRQAELLKWEAFAHWLSAQMPAEHFDKTYNRFCKQYRPEQAS